MMDDQSLAELERRLGQQRSIEAPDALRALTLLQVKRELRAARWDRRLGRIAAALVLTGIGLNAGVGLISEHSTSASIFATNDALVRTGVAVARATDVETGRMMAHQLAVIQDQSISPQQLAAIDAAIDAALRQENEG
jgi:hypothetical protein